jgi:hypothetical protein
MNFTNLHDRAPEIDISELESLFSAVSDTTAKKSTGRRGSSISKPEKVQLVDLRRANNCEIMLTKIKIPLPDMLSAVLALDSLALDIDQVENLIKFCPTKEEMELLRVISIFIVIFLSSTRFIGSSCLEILLSFPSEWLINVSEPKKDPVD